MIWVVCGAGRGVGKTAVARAISDALAGSIYCKCGHNPAKADKCGNFFNGVDKLNEFVDRAVGRYRHIVVESNAFVYYGRADVVIFVDGIEGKTDFRDDVQRLTEAADIKVCRGSLIQQWKDVLCGKLRDEKEIDAVCRCLLSQSKYFKSLIDNV